MFVYSHLISMFTTQPFATLTFHSLCRSFWHPRFVVFVFMPSLRCVKISSPSQRLLTMRNCLLFVWCAVSCHFNIEKKEQILSQVNVVLGQEEKSQYQDCVYSCLSRDNCESWTLIVHYKIRIRHLFSFERCYDLISLLDNLIVCGLITMFRDLHEPQTKWKKYTYIREGVRITLNLICKCSKSVVRVEKLFCKLFIEKKKSHKTRKTFVNSWSCRARKDFNVVLRC